MLQIAIFSVHSCPLAPLGGQKTGGMNVYVQQSARELARRGHQVDIFTRWHDSDLPELFEAEPNLRVIHIEAGDRVELAPDDIYPHLPAFTAGVRAYAQRHARRYDLIHSHYWLSGLVGLSLQAEWHIPHIAMFHTLGEVKRRARVGESESDLRIEAERRVVAGADRIVGSTAHERDSLIRLYGADPGRIEIIPCGVDLDLFRPIDKLQARQKLGLNEQHILLYVGRIEPLKGIDILISAVSRLEGKREVSVLVIGGDGRNEEMERLRRLAREKGVAKQVSFLGAVEQQKLPLFYSAADVCVLPSHYESFGLVALESLACGTPVVASRVGGLPATVHDGSNGYLIPWRCPEAFAERLELLLESDLLRQNLGHAARASVERYSWSYVAERTIQLYGAVLVTRGRASTQLPPAGPV